MLQLLVEGFPRQRNQAHLLGWLYVFQRYSGKSIDMEYDFKSYDRCSFITILRRTLLEGFPVWEAFFIFIKEA